MTSEPHFSFSPLSLMQHITLDSYIPCLTDLCKALWEVMLSYHRTIQWHEEQDRQESSVAGKKWRTKGWEGTGGKFEVNGGPKEEESLFLFFYEWEFIQHYRFFFFLDLLRSFTTKLILKIRFHILLYIKAKAFSAWLPFHHYQVCVSPRRLGWWWVERPGFALCHLISAGIVRTAR